jgi:hypothetical protein
MSRFGIAEREEAALAEIVGAPIAIFDQYQTKYVPLQLSPSRILFPCQTNNCTEFATIEFNEALVTFSNPHVHDNNET